MAQFYALLSDQGTACDETGLCAVCIEDEDAKTRAASYGYDDIDKDKGFVDVTGNNAIYCTQCGLAPEGERELSSDDVDTVADAFSYIDGASGIDKLDLLRKLVLLEDKLRNLSGDDEGRG